MGKVFISGIVPQKVAPVTFKSNFADNDWSTIIKACQTNEVPDTWTVGSQKTMTINGTNYAIDIIGKNHDIYSDGGGTAPLTFQLHDCYGTLYSMNTTSTNSGGWGNCDMRWTHLKSILKLMPAEVQEGIVPVMKYTAGGNGNQNVGGSSDALFLLSEVEVHGNLSLSYAGEGTQYDYYKAGNSKVKTFSGNVKQWWVRSPIKVNDLAFCCVGDDGNPANGGAINSFGVAFAFCF